MSKKRICDKSNNPTARQRWWGWYKVACTMSLYRGAQMIILGLAFAPPPGSFVKKFGYFPSDFFFSYRRSCRLLFEIFHCQHFIDNTERVIPPKITRRRCCRLILVQWPLTALPATKSERLLPLLKASPRRRPRRPRSRRSRNLTSRWEQETMLRTASKHSPMRRMAVLN